MTSFLIRSATSQSGSYQIALTRLGGPRSKPNSHLKFVEVIINIIIIIIIIIYYY